MGSWGPCFSDEERMSYKAAAKDLKSYDQVVTHIDEIYSPELTQAHEHQATELIEYDSKM